MNRDQVQHFLEKRGVRPSAFSLKSPVADEAYCLERASGGWSVYYSERGNRNDERWFRTEEEALAALSDLVLADPTTRNRDGGSGPVDAP